MGINIFPGQRVEEARSVNDSNIRVNRQFEDGTGQVYQFCEYSDTTAGSVKAGDPVGLTTADEGSTVTGSLAESSADKFVGIAMSSMGSINKFGYVLVKGNFVDAKDIKPSTDSLQALKANVSTAVASGDFLKWGVTGKLTDVAPASASATAGVIVGIAYEADAAGKLAKGRLYGDVR